MTDYRYILEPYKGIKTRYTCPACNRKHKFTRYIDTETGNHLPDQYGRCDREESCGYHLNPYKDGYHKGNLSDNHKPIWKPKSLEKAKEKPREAVTIPYEIFKQSLKGYESNSFVQYLNGLLGEAITKEMINRFQIGTSKFWEGATVFWLINTQMQIVGGQVILYNESGKTHREDKPDGSVKRFNSWVHVALKSHYQSQDKTLPEWLKTYSEESPKFPCLFGLHQLKTELKTKPIAIVEAAKTAIIASAYFPDYIWMAIGSLSYLNRERLTGLEGRKITLFPDKGGFEKWKDKTKELTDFARFTISDLLEKAEAKDGSDLADYLVKYDIREFRLLPEVEAVEKVNIPQTNIAIRKPLQEETKLEKMMMKNPVLKQMTQIFNLQIYKPSKAVIQ